MAKLVCVICDAEKPVPKCCGNEEMQYRGGYLNCKFCGAVQYLPNHCSKMMKVKD